MVLNASFSMQEKQEVYSGVKRPSVSLDTATAAHVPGIERTLQPP